MFCYEWEPVDTIKGIGNAPKLTLDPSKGGNCSLKILEAFDIHIEAG